MAQCRDKCSNTPRCTGFEYVTGRHPKHVNCRLEDYSFGGSVGSKGFFAQRTACYQKIAGSSRSTVPVTISNGATNAATTKKRTTASPRATPQCTRILTAEATGGTGYACVGT